MALTGEVDLDSENYNATKLKQTSINGVTCNDCKLKRCSEITSHSDLQSPHNSRIVTCCLLPRCHLLFFTAAPFS